MNANRRQYSRLKLVDETCTVFLRGEEHKVELLEESIGGIKIGGVKLLNLVCDEHVIASVRDEKFEAKCRNIERDPKGGFRLGLKRDAINSGTKRMLLNSYIANEGCHFICFVTSQENPASPKICLWNQHELTVSRNDLFPLTESERRQQLADPDYCRFVAHVYGMPAHTLPQQILDFEF